MFKLGLYTMTKSNLTVSIIIPVHNELELINKSLQSGRVRISKVWKPLERNSNEGFLGRHVEMSPKWNKWMNFYKDYYKTL